MDGWMKAKGGWKYSADLCLIWIRLNWIEADQVSTYLKELEGSEQHVASLSSIPVHPASKHKPQLQERLQA
jgi:hypothetical protein